jgi:hypothetical protein
MSTLERIMIVDVVRSESMADCYDSHERDTPREMG